MPSVRTKIPPIVNFMRKGTTEKTGDCFEAALKFIKEKGLEDPDRYTLVHGNIAHLNQEEEINHAWIEEGDIVHEVSKGKHQRFLNDRYYEKFKVTKTRKYTLIEALKESIKNKHWGPWP